ncbi:kynureninase [Armatimonas sp.]|uniref:kynureninase n=1 Tax=Armatimonas sp. TaxID=1872638 RepID=UPI00286CFBEE|nr:kynureninase [Armatimonas sp.]
MVYLDGNSLGLLTDEAEQAVLRTLSEWRELAIHGWTEGTHPWLFLAERTGAQLARLIGAEAKSVVAMGSITVNLHQLLATLYDGKGKVLIEHGAFPTDRYALQSHLKLRGVSEGLVAVAPDEAEIEVAFATGEFSCAVLPSVVYTTGQLLDMPRLTESARRHGVVLLWDLAHSIGIVPHQLDAWGCDAAFWCGYKWLSAGPGSVGGLYLNARHHEKTPGLQGWFGSRKDALFAGDDTLQSAEGAARLQLGTSHILSLAPLEATVKALADYGIERLRQESLALTALLRTEAENAGFTVVTPRDAARRGGHIAIQHPHAAALCRALRQHQIIPDHRPPDLIRFAPHPLYTTEADCKTAITTLKMLTEQETLEIEASLIP